VPVEVDFAFCWFFKTEDDSTQGRFAAAALSHKAEGFALADGEVHAVHRPDSSHLAAYKPAGDGVMFPDPAQNDQFAAL